MDAPGAIDSLLGRLTTVLVNEAQLLGGVRSDVEFIKDEMESMNGLILYLTEAQNRDHQVRAWMKQVVGLTRDCEGNVELYIHYVGSRPGDDGLLGHLRRIMRFLRTIPVRHRIATRIRELKVRARDVGDRRRRYGVTVPASRSARASNHGTELVRVQEHLRQRAVLLDGVPTTGHEEVVTRGIDTLVKCLSVAEPAIQDGDGAPAHPQVRVFTVLGTEWLLNKVAEKVYQDSSVSTLFDCKAWSDGGDVGSVLAEILQQVGGVQLEPRQEEEDEVTNQAGAAVDMELIICRIQGRLKGKRFLIIVTDSRLEQRECKRILDALSQAADGSLPGSAIIVTTEDYDLGLAFSPYKIIHVRAPWDWLYIFYREEEKNRRLSEFADLIIDTHDLISHNIFATKMFLHLLYVNPIMTRQDMEDYKKSLSDCIRLQGSISKQVLAWCYNELPSKYRSYLLYLTVFPEGHVIRTTSLARRWVAETLVTANGTSSAAATEEIQSSTDEAEHCLDVLFIRGFLSPLEISAEGNIKSFTVHREVREFITRVATDVSFIDSSLPPHLARYLSIHNRIGWQQSISDGDTDSKDIAAHLPSLSESPQWQLLKVLDLEDCKGLDRKHMKSICKILLLKYLSLRNTDVTELPKQIKELQCLETLDIRQTKVRMLAKKAIVLPLLKHFLAGRKASDSNGTMTSGESFSAVKLPLGIHKMKNMEILSHVKLTDSDSELTGIAQLLKLRKLGVVLHGKSAKLSDLFCQIEKLHRCLRALSIRIDPLAGPEVAGTEDALPCLPQFIERLNICCISNGISSFVEEQHQLTKITLSETCIKDHDLGLLGRLRGLCWLRLQQNSYSNSELAFKEDEFQSLKYLLVKCSSITKISFANGAAPKLERAVLSFDRMDGLSGIHHLSKLKELEVNGERILLGHS